MRVPTVLVVDDDDAIREITRLALEVVSKWTVVTADGGEQALELARANPPDAVLLDLMMPVVDGRATFLALRADARTADVPVILLTAKLQVGQAQPWDDLDVAGVISKPFSPMTLGSQVAQLLAWDDVGG